MNWRFAAERLTALREANGESQEAFAAKIGTSKQHVSQWEARKLTPTTSTVVKICNVYGVPPSFFYLQGGRC